MPSGKQALLAALLLHTVLAAPLTHASNVEALYREALELRESGDAAAALSRFETVVRAAPEHRNATLALVYLLTDSARFDEAQLLAAGWTQRNPQDAGGWLAAAYAWRHGGDAGRALNAYQHAGDLEPTNTDARVGKILMLRATGAAQPALLLALRHPTGLPAGLLDELRQDVAAYLIRMARDASGTPAERAARLTEAERLLGAIEEPTPGVQADRVALFEARGAYAQAAARFDEWFPAAAAAPAWGTYAAASSLLALQRPLQALTLFETLLRADPRDVQAQRGRFHALSDLGRFEEAQVVADGLAAFLRRSGDVDAARDAHVLRAYARAWGGQLLAARTILEDEIAADPTSAKLNAALGWVLAWSELPAAAQTHFDAALTLDAQYLDARIGQVALLQHQDDVTQAAQALAELEGALGSESAALARLTQDQQRLAAPWVWARAATELERDADSRTFELEAGSAPMGAHNVQLQAGIARRAYEGPSGVWAETRTRAGVQFGTDRSRLRLSAHRLSETSETGFRLAWDGQLAPDWKAAARLTTHDDAVAVGARLARVSATSSAAELTWRADARRAAWASVGHQRFSDDNAVTSLSAGVRWLQELGAPRTVRWSVSTGVSAARTDAVPYFSPRAAWWLQVQPEFATSVRVGAEETTAVRWTLEPLVGLYGQRGFGFKPYLGLAAGLSWDFSKTASLGLHASSVRRPYDGQYELQHALALTLFLRLP